MRNGFGFGFPVSNKGGVGVSPPFSPLDLPNPILWLDAPDATKINTGTPIDLDQVNTFVDKSPGSNNFINITGIQQPIWHANGFGSNNLPYISFDGIDDFLENTLLNIAKPISICIIFRMGDIVGTQVLMSSRTTSTYQIFTSSANYDIFNGATLVGGAITTAARVTNNLYDGLNSEIKINNLATVVGNSGTGSSSTGLYFGRSSIGQFAHVDMAEMIISDKPSPTQLTDLINYANSKYGGLF